MIMRPKTRCRLIIGAASPRQPKIDRRRAALRPPPGGCAEECKPWQTHAASAMQPDSATPDPALESAQGAGEADSVALPELDVSLSAVRQASSRVAQDQSQDDDEGQEVRRHPPAPLRALPPRLFDPLLHSFVHFDDLQF